MGGHVGDDGDRFGEAVLTDEQFGQIGCGPCAGQSAQERDRLLDAAVLREEPGDGQLAVVDLVGRQRLDLCDRFPGASRRAASTSVSRPPRSRISSTSRGRTPSRWVDCH
ncbi:hypothetical protein FNH09_21900 [Streptomyces adustus]|uniref:Uncharacterized protein n=1 Tax=Streptomyces adustus TaxID=1609272 RepID=A0A5N8VEX6_9ACTN|nr:hypothetical protein [Streptomyces adustus]